MKKNIIIGILVCFILVATVAPGKVAAAAINAVYSDIKIHLDGGELKLMDSKGDYVTPVVVNGSLYLPMRPLASAFGYKVTYDDASRIASLDYDGLAKYPLTYYPCTCVPVLEEVFMGDHAASLCESFSGNDGKYMFYYKESDFNGSIGYLSIYGQILKDSGFVYSAAKTNASGDPVLIYLNADKNTQVQLIEGKTNLAVYIADIY